MDSRSSVCRKSAEAVCRRSSSAEKAVFLRHPREEWPFSFWNLDFRFSIAGAPAQKQLRPSLPETRSCGQIDPGLASDQPECLPRSRTKCRLIKKERIAVVGRFCEAPGPFRWGV